MGIFERDSTSNSKQRGKKVLPDLNFSKLVKQLRKQPNGMF